MNNATLVLLLQIAGLLHIGLMCAGLAMPKVVNLYQHVGLLPVFIRRLFYVYYAFIALCLVSFGAITFFYAVPLAGGDALARALCIFLTVFWTLRLIAAVFIFDVRPYLTSPWLRLGYHSTSLAFIYLPAVYVLAAWKGGPP